MNAIDYKIEAKKVLDILPDDKTRAAFNLLEYLRGLEVRDQLGASALRNWVECLTDRDKEEFLEELLESIENASSNGNWSQITELVECWEETAEILSDKQLMAGIREAQEEIARGETISWEEVSDSLLRPK